jgi:hypothetical protein
MRARVGAVDTWLKTLPIEGGLISEVGTIIAQNKVDTSSEYSAKIKASQNSAN